jgi:hypothetical protein
MTLSIVSERLVNTAAGRTASVSPAAAPVAAAHEVVEQRDRHGAGDRRRQPQRHRREPEQPRRCDLQPHVQRRLVDRQLGGRVEGAIWPITPTASRRTHEV